MGGAITTLTVDAAHCSCDSSEILLGILLAEGCEALLADGDSRFADTTLLTADMTELCDDAEEPPPAPAVDSLGAYPISFVAKRKRKRLNPLLLLLG